jgi:GNAT superfamily N-acetyltransferase
MNVEWELLGPGGMNWAAEDFIPTRRPMARLRCSTGADLSLLLLWTGWDRDDVLPHSLKEPDAREAFERGEFRTLVMEEQGRVAGLSIVSAAPLISPCVWRLPHGAVVPCSECLYWVTVAVDPQYRRRGLGRCLFQATLLFAISTGYPYVLATYPGTSDATGLLGHLGFVRVTLVDGSSPSRASYLRPTRLPTEPPRRRESDQ